MLHADFLVSHMKTESLSNEDIKSPFFWSRASLDERARAVECPYLTIFFPLPINYLKTRHGTAYSNEVLLAV